MNDQRKDRTRRLAGLAVVGLAVVVLSALAVAVLGDAAVGALLGALIVLASLGLLLQWRDGRRNAANLAAVSRALTDTQRQVAAIAKQSETAIPALSKEVTTLSKTVAQWSKDVREAEIETGIAALNRYIALGSDDTAHQG